MNDLAPNDIGMEFKQHPRFGNRAVIPSLYKNAQRSVSTAYDNSFGVRGAKLFNLLPKAVNQITELNSLKAALGDFLSTFPDTPPVRGYVAVNGNSLLEWGANQHSAVGVKGGCELRGVPL